LGLGGSFDASDCIGDLLVFETVSLPFWSRLNLILPYALNHSAMFPRVAFLMLPASRFRLQNQEGETTFKGMSAQDIIEQIKCLPPMERAAVAKFIVEQDDSWIPDEFKEAIKDAEEGRCVEMETALSETPPSRLQ